MALTYYIRSWDPRSTYPSNPQEGDICYTITLDQTWSPVGGVKKDNIVKEEIYQSGAWVEQGGGGSSETVLYDGAYTTVELSPGFYGVPLLMYESVPEPLPTYIKAVYSGETIMLPLASEDNATYGEVDGEGAPIFDNYPIAIALSGDGDYATMMILVTQTAETGSFKASAVLNGGSVSLESLDVTENGDYYADEGMGWDEVHVAVVPSVTMGNLKLTNQTGVTLYAESFSVTDSVLVSGTSEPIIISNNSTKNVAVPLASATTAYISFDLILKCATSAGDISNLACTVTAPSSSVPGSDFSAIVHGTYRPSDPGDTNMRAVAHFYGFIPGGMVSEMSVTLTLS